MIETTRLTLRKMNVQDANDLFSMRSNPLMHLHTDTSVDHTINDTLAYIAKMNEGMDQGKWYVWAIELKETGKVIGSISLWNFNEDKTEAELGLCIHPDFQNQGYMSEALNTLCDYVFANLSLIKIDAYTEIANASCRALLHHCGFQITGNIDDPGYIQNRTFHMVIYSKVK